MLVLELGKLRSATKTTQVNRARAMPGKVGSSCTVSAVSGRRRKSSTRSHAGVQVVVGQPAISYLQ